MLEVRDAEVAYGNIRAVKGVSLDVPAGGFVTVLGANGAGKTSLLRAMTGLVRLRAGSIHLDGTPIGRAAPDRIVRLGLVMVPERREIFPEMSVHENLLMGAYVRRDQAAVRGDLDQVYAVFPALVAKRHHGAGTLSGGQQQMVAIGRAMMARPRLLVLDEPSLGLAPLLVDQIFAAIRRIHDGGTAVVLVEQNARLALAMADYGYVLSDGRVTLAGTATELSADNLVQQSYLGAI